MWETKALIVKFSLQCGKIVGGLGEGGSGIFVGVRRSKRAELQWEPGWEGVVLETNTCMQSPPKRERGEVPVIHPKSLKTRRGVFAVTSADALDQTRLCTRRIASPLWRGWQIVCRCGSQGYHGMTRQGCLREKKGSLHP